MRKLYIILTATFLLFFSCPPKTDKEYDLDLRVHFIDVGHGDCIFIETPNDTIDGNGEREGYKILIDSGKKGRGTEYVIPYLEDKLKMKAGDVIDYVIATHAHEDHIGGMPEIYNKYQINKTLDPGYRHTSIAYNDFYEKASSEPNSNFYFNLVASGLITGNGDYLDLGNELEVRILHTNPDAGEGINNTSIVLWVKYQSVTFLFTADAEGKERNDPPTVVKFVEQYLIDHYEDSELRSNVLQVGHHGSETSSTNDFIQAVQPEYAVVLAGRGSFSGVILPDETVLQRYRDVGAELLRTDEDDEGKTESEAGGDDNFVIRTDGSEITVERN